MTVPDFFIKGYSYLRNYCLPPKFMGLVRLVFRKTANMIIPKIFSKPYINKQSKKTEDLLIVSLTSFPARINNVWQVVECMFRQTLRPSYIFLWLSRDQFTDVSEIPESLRSREGNMFKIRLVDGDIRSHKKYYYVSKEFPYANVLLIDDDILYPSDFIEKTYSEFKKNGKVICNFGSIIQYNLDGGVAPYNVWPMCYKSTDSRDFFFGSGGGVLFKPSKMYKDLTDIDLALRLAPRADDVWLNAMVRLAGLEVKKIKSGLIFPIDEGEEDNTLSSINLRGGNDVQIQAVNDYYNSILGRRVFVSNNYNNSL